MSKVLAFDFGASSMRAIRAELAGEKIVWEEIFRMENIPVEKDGRLYWNFAALTDGVRQALKEAGPVDSIAFDTWGVDFGLLGDDGKLLDDPVHYRDARSLGMPELAAETLGAERLYAETGLQPMGFNTLYQLMGLKKQQPELLKGAQRLLFMPDLLAFMLCGEAVCERSIASTSQLMDPRTGTWNPVILDTFGIPDHIFARPVTSGTVIGEYQGAKVVSVAGHDTQSATAAMTEDPSHTAFLSCGTWSLLGAVLPAPVLDEKSCKEGFSNEMGMGGINYLKNIVGLWILQECRREWQAEGKDYSYGDMEKMAREAEAFRSLINADDERFNAPGPMTGRIRAFCEETGQPVPETDGQIIRCIYESLALKYRLGVDQLEEMTGRTFDGIQVLGGGSQSVFLCEQTAAVSGRRVIAGPTEATALGNIVVQLLALGEIPDVAAGQKIVKASESFCEYPAGNAPGAETAVSRMRSLCHLS